MNPLKPEEALFLQQQALRSLKSEHAITKRVIQAVPVDKGDYRPDAVSKSALDLAWHIASAENFFLSAIADGEFRAGSPRPENIRNSADVAAWHTEQFDANYDRIANLSAEQLSKIVDFRGFMQQPAIAYAQFCLHHEIHHRGQLSAYLRPMGAKVPSIYGESHDDAEARKSRELETQSA